MERKRACFRRGTIVGTGGQELPDLAGKVCVGIGPLDPFTETPVGGPIRDVGYRRTNLRLARMEQGHHFSFPVEDEGTRVALGRERAELLVIVINGDFDRPDAVVVAHKRLKSGAAANGEIGRAAVLHDDDAGLPFVVEGLRVGQLLFGDKAPNLQETVGGIFGELKR